ncbi:MAG: hypothetical protein WBA57_21380 [Elainellaceae cyanobacterium]
MSNIERKYVELIESLIAQLGGTPIEPNETTNYDQRFTQLVAQAIPLLVQVAAGGAGATLPGDIVALPDVQTPLINIITALTGEPPSSTTEVDTLFSEFAIALLSYVPDQGGTLASGAVIASLNGLIADLGGTVAESTGNGTTDATVAIATLRPLIAALKSTDEYLTSDTPPPSPPIGVNRYWRHTPTNILFYYDFDFDGDEYWVSTELFSVNAQGVFDPADYPGNDLQTTVPLVSVSRPYAGFRMGFDGYSIMGFLPFDSDRGQPLTNRAAWNVIPFIYSQDGGLTEQSEWISLLETGLAFVKFEHQRVEASWKVASNSNKRAVIQSGGDDRHVIIAANLQKDPSGANDPLALRLSMTFNLRYLYPPA